MSYWYLYQRQRRYISFFYISIDKSSIYFADFQLYNLIFIDKPKHKVKWYDILCFCIKYTLFWHVLVPDKTSFLTLPLKVPLSDMSVLTYIESKSRNLIRIAPFSTTFHDEKGTDTLKTFMNRTMKFMNLPTCRGLCAGGRGDGCPLCVGKK